MGLAIDLKLAGYTAATLPCYLAASNLQMQHSADSSYSSAFAVVRSIIGDAILQTLGSSLHFAGGFSHSQHFASHIDLASRVDFGSVYPGSHFHYSGTHLGAVEILMEEVCKLGQEAGRSRPFDWHFD